MKKTIIITSFLLIAFATGSVFAWENGSPWGLSRGSGQNCPVYRGQNTAVDLSKEQTDELWALKQKFIDDTYEIRSQKFAKQQEINMLMETSNPDREKLSKLIKQVSKLQTQMKEKQIDLQLAAKKIAPELTKQRGFGKSRGKESYRGGQKSCPQGQSSGCGRY